MNRFDEEEESVYSRIKLEEERKLDGVMPHYVISLLYFDPPIDVVIASYLNGDVVVYRDNKDSTETLANIGDHEGCCNHMIKWDENTFITCSEDGSSRIYQIDLSSSPPIIKKSVIQNLGCNFRMLKVDQDSYLIVCRISPCYRISYSRKEVITTYRDKIDGVYWNTKLERSINHNKCFYVSNNKNTIVLYNFLDGNIVKTFSGATELIYCIKVFLNNQNEEILISAGYELKIFIHNTQLESTTPLQIIKPTNQSWLMSMDCVKFSKSIIFSIGDLKGNFSSFLIRDGDITKNGVICIIPSTKIHYDLIFDVKVKLIDTDYVTFLTGDRGKQIKRVKVKGLSFLNYNLEIAKKDTQERILYLCEEMEECFVKIQLYDQQILSLRTLLIFM